MASTIQISQKLQETLMERKIVDSESYEDVIWDMIEDVFEISEETQKMLKEAENDVNEGKVFTLNEVKRELNV